MEHGVDCGEVMGHYELQHHAAAVAADQFAGDRSVGYERGRLERAKGRWTMGLFIAGRLAAISGLAGLSISGLSLLGFVNAGGIAAAAGTLALSGSFFLLMLAAHCVDKRHAVELEIRAKTGLRD